MVNVVIAAIIAAVWLARVFAKTHAVAAVVVVVFRGVKKRSMAASLKFKIVCLIIIEAPPRCVSQHF